MNKNRVLKYILLLVYTVLLCFFFSPSDSPFLKTKFIFLLTTFSLFVFLDLWIEKLFRIVLILSAVISLITFPTFVVYGKIDSGFIESALYTNVAQSVSYAKTLNLWVFLIAILFFVSCLFIAYYKPFNKLPKIKNTFVKLLSFLLIAVSFYPSINKYREDSTLEPQYYIFTQPIYHIVKIPYLSYSTLKVQKELDNIKQKQDSWEIVQNTNNQAERLVVVIGESLGKNLLHSYGFPLKNTPFIDSSKVIQFNNYLSFASHTVPSLFNTLKVGKNRSKLAFENNLVTLAQKLGYEVTWISNQTKIGRHETPISRIAAYSDTTIYLNNSQKIGVETKDIKLLSYLPYFSAKKGKQMLVLHMKGSHPSIQDRVIGEYEQFYVNEDLSCHSKVVEQTDDILRNVYEALLETKDSFKMIYFSDHGLTYKEEKLVHGNSKQSYQVPLLYWSSDMTDRQEIDVFRQGSDFLHFFSEVLGVQTANIKRPYKFISDQEYLKEDELILFDSIPYNTLEDIPLPVLSN